MIDICTEKIRSLSEIVAEKIPFSPKSDIWAEGHTDEFLEFETDKIYVNK